MTEAHSAIKQRNDSHGSGLCYSLALFLSHEAEFARILAEVETMAAEGALEFQGRDLSQPQRQRAIIERLASIRWFSRSVGPLTELVIPATLPQDLRQRLERLQEQCVNWAYPGQRSGPMSRDVGWAIDEAKELIRLLDEHHGVRTRKEKTKSNAPKSPFLIFRSEDQSVSESTA